MKTWLPNTPFRQLLRQVWRYPATPGVLASYITSALILFFYSLPDLRTIESCTDGNNVIVFYQDQEKYKVPLKHLDYPTAVCLPFVAITRLFARTFNTSNPIGDHPEPTVISCGLAPVISQPTTRQPEPTPMENSEKDPFFD